MKASTDDEQHQRDGKATRHCKQNDGVEAEVVGREGEGREGGRREGGREGEGVEGGE